MVSKTHRSGITDIVSPAGNVDKLRFAVAYGADAVYFGGEQFNLRVQAGNFTREDIETSLALCRENKVQTVFLLNSFLHEHDIDAAKKYLAGIKSFHFDALMVSDPGMKELIKDAGIDADIHLSTQLSVLNHLTVRFWEKAGIKRIVLARETKLDEIRMIRDHSDVELEIFVHGALCVAYSGRCLLSRYLTGRDANQGDCSQPCRWNYSLIEKKRPGHYMDIIEHATGTEVLSSKDLCLIDRVDEYREAGVNAFKIEGRMKSLYYAANTTRIYKHAVTLAGTEEYHRHVPFWNNELDLVNHRPYTNDLFNEFNNMGFEPIPYVKKVLFAGYKKDMSGPAREICVRTHNPVYREDTLDAIFPITDGIRDHSVTVLDIRTTDGTPVDMARPGDEYYITIDKPVDDHAIFRKRL